MTPLRGHERPPGWEQARDCTVSMLAANVVGVLIIAPIVAILAWLYAVRWSWGALFAPSAPPGTLTIVILFVFGIVLHELIHGMTWTLLSGRGRGLVTYGFKWATLTPYAHAREPLPARAYRIGAAMPGMLLGLLPALVGIISGHTLTLYVGLMMTAAAGGDLLLLWLLRGTDHASLVLDHPSKPGCLVLDAPNGAA